MIKGFYRDVEEDMDFDYEKKIWGSGETEFSLLSLWYLKLRWFLQDVPDAGRGRLLDIGCGRANLTMAIKQNRQNLAVYGADISRKALAEAKSEFGGIKFICCSLEKLLFPDNYFDIVSGFDILEHLKNPFTVLREACRILKPGGVLHIACPLEGERATLYWFLRKFGWQKKRLLAGHVQAFSRTNLQKAVEKAGFEIMNKRYSFHVVGQIIDILFYTFLAGSNSEREHIKQAKLLKKIASLLINSESLLLQNINGGCAHWTMRKIG